MSSFIKQEFEDLDNGIIKSIDKEIDGVKYSIKLLEDGRVSATSSDTTKVILYDNGYAAWVNDFSAIHTIDEDSKGTLIENIAQNDNLRKTAAENGLTFSYDEDSGYFDFNLKNQSKQFKDVLDLVTYYYDEDKDCLMFHDTQVNEVIGMGMLPQILKTENDVANVIKIIADKLEKDFSDDKEKMKDFYLLPKAEFLASYSYLTEEEYDFTSNKPIYLNISNGLFKEALEQLSAECLEKIKTEIMENDTEGREQYYFQFFDEAEHGVNSILRELMQRDKLEALPEDFQMSDDMFSTLTTFIDKKIGYDYEAHEFTKILEAKEFNADIDFSTNSNYEFMRDDDLLKFVESLIQEAKTPSHIINTFKLSNICIIVLDKDANIKQLIENDIYENDEIKNYDKNYYLSDILSSLVENKQDTISDGYKFEINLLLKAIKAGKEYQEYEQPQKNKTGFLQTIKDSPSLKEQVIQDIKDWHSACEQGLCGDCEVYDALKNNINDDRLIDIAHDIDPDLFNKYTDETLSQQLNGTINSIKIDETMDVEKERADLAQKVNAPQSQNLSQN